MQIDVVKVDGQTVTCNLYTGQRVVRILMHVADYENLIRDGFFIRDGKRRDDAKVLNTTLTYQAQNPRT